MTIEEYLRTSFHPDVEFVDDHIEEKSLGSVPQSLLQAELALWFGSRKQLWGIRVMTEVRTRTAALRIRLPDVCVVLANAVPSGMTQNAPPLIAIEILSPEDRLPRIIPRLDEFVRMGIEHVWVLDPVERTAFTYTALELKPVRAHRLELPNSPIYLDLGEIFAALD